MGRTYAATLGLTAFLTSVVRSWAGGSPIEAMLWEAWLALTAFAMLGWASGWLAGWIVDDAVHRRVAEELAVNKAPSTTTRTEANP